MLTREAPSMLQFLLFKTSDEDGKYLQSHLTVKSALRVLIQLQLLEPIEGIALVSCEVDSSS